MVFPIQIVEKLKNNEARPKLNGSYKKKACDAFSFGFVFGVIENASINLLICVHTTIFILFLQK